MAFPRLTKPIKRRARVLSHATIRQFDGGWNVIDNDLNLSSKFAKVLDNMMRMPDGSIGKRWGTRLLYDVNDFADETGDLADNPLTTDGLTPIVEVAWTLHPFISGQKVTFSGLTTVGGIPAGELNTEHVVAYVDANKFTVTVTTTSTSATTGGGTAGEYSFNQGIKNGGVTDVRIVNMTYGEWEGTGYTIIVGDNACILAVDGAGTPTLIWSPEIAGSLSGGPDPWTSPLSFASFARFGDSLIVCNGVDKPIDIDLSRSPTGTRGYVEYLQNPSGDNSYIPAAKYVITSGEYLVMSGVAAFPNHVYISGYRAKGCWANSDGTVDPDGTCSASVPLPTRIIATRFINSGDSVIRGLAHFRDRALILFSHTTILAKLGNYNADTNEHLPEFSDVVNNYGALSHRTVQSVGDDLLMMDSVGVPSLKHSVLSDNVRPSRVSELIDPEIQKCAAVAQLDGTTPMTEGALEDHTFAVYNPNEAQYMLFVPNHPDEAQTTETVGFVYTTNDALQVRAWCRFRGMNWACGTTTALNRVLLAESGKVYVYGNDYDPIYADKVDDTAVETDGLGLDVDFSWELPWADFDNRVRIKQSRFIAIDSIGESAFTLSMFVDNQYYVDGVRTPQLTMDFVGGSSAGFGVYDPPPEYYGGHRRASDERVFTWPAKFKIAKLRVDGSSKNKLRLVALSLSYMKGDVRI